MPRVLRTSPVLSGPRHTVGSRNFDAGSASFSVFREPSSATENRRHRWRSGTRRGWRRTRLDESGHHRAKDWAACPETNAPPTALHRVSTAFYDPVMAGLDFADDRILAGRSRPGTRTPSGSCSIGTTGRCSDSLASTCRPRPWPRRWSSRPGSR